MASVYSPADAIPIPTAAETTVPEDTKMLAGPSGPSEETHFEDVAEPAASSAESSAGANVPKDFLDPIFNRERVPSSYGLSSDELRARTSVTRVTVKDNIKGDTEDEATPATEQNRSDSLPGQGDSQLQESAAGIVERTRAPYLNERQQYERFNPQPPSISEAYGILPHSGDISISGQRASKNTKQVNFRFTHNGETLTYSSTQNGEFPPVSQSQCRQTAMRDPQAAYEDLGQPIRRDRAYAEQAEKSPTSDSSVTQNTAGSKPKTQTFQATRNVSARINDNKAYGKSTQKNSIVYHTHPAQGSEPSNAGILHRSHQNETVTLPGGVTAAFQDNEKAKTAVQENLIVGPGFNFPWGKF